MKETKLIADEKGRITCAEFFPPRSVFKAEVQPSGNVMLTKLEPVEVPVVRARKVGGRWIGADLQLDRQAVVDSIRADREER